MVNPSGLPKKRKKSKSRRRNPELLIVNPYSLEDEDNQKKRAKMAKRKRKSKKSSRSKRRKNPLARRKNPGLDLDTIKDQFLGPDLENVKKAAMMAVGGGLALAVGTAALGTRLGVGGALGKGLVAVLSGVLGGVAVSKLGETLLPGNEMVQQLAVAGAMGAMVLGAWAIAQPVVEPWADAINARLGFAGLGSWTKEFDGLDQAYYDEFTTGVAPGMDGYGHFGQPVIAATDLTDPADNPFLSGYEPLGDIYNSQRLGSFEAETGLGGFVPETANPRDQQVADEMKHAAGAYGGYEGTLFEPFIED